MTLAWLVSHSVVGLALGSVALSAVVNVAALLTLPLWFWALPAGSDYWGLLPVDQAWGALLGAALALPLAVLTVPLRVMAEAEARMAAALLGPVAERPARATGAAQRAARPPRDPGVALGVHAGLAAVAVAITCTVWLLTSRGSFWPVWVALGVTLTCGLQTRSSARSAPARAAPTALWPPPRAAWSSSACASPSGR